ncbi:unnamed protein product [Diabrotica balteata]|uniref:Ig-like domain-containing protein n=1 Tax=Diabrotica balteata TaxID=107213 RepID=A0A9N9X7W4_DIABA|nr:unnamed protein product [Diabrotica balteata]
MVVPVHPLIQVRNQLVGAPVNTDVTLQCHVEASPKAINYWTRESGEMIISNDKYYMTEINNSYYSVQMKLIIRRYHKADQGGYKCISKNSIGDAEGNIRLYEVEIPQRVDIVEDTEQTSAEEENSENSEKRLYNGFQGPHSENEQNNLPLNESDFTKKEIEYPSLSANDDDVNLRVPNSDKIIVQKVLILQSPVETITQTEPPNLTDIYGESSDDKNINEGNIENAFGTRTNNLNVIVEEVQYIEKQYILPLVNYTTMNNNHNDDSQEYLEGEDSDDSVKDRDYTPNESDGSSSEDIENRFNKEDHIKKS